MLAKCSVEHDTSQEPPVPFSLCGECSVSTACTRLCDDVSQKLTMTRNIKSQNLKIVKPSILRNTLQRFFNFRTLDIYSSNAHRMFLRNKFHPFDQLKNKDNPFLLGEVRHQLQ